MERKSIAGEWLAMLRKLATGSSPLGRMSSRRYERPCRKSVSTFLAKPGHQNLPEAA